MIEIKVSLIIFSKNYYINFLLSFLLNLFTHYLQFYRIKSYKFDKSRQGSSPEPHFIV